MTARTNWKRTMRRAKDRELLKGKGKGHPSAYRMQTFTDGNALPDGAIICSHDIHLTPDGRSYEAVRAWVPVKPPEATN